jgi:hypothetical protein
MTTVSGVLSTVGNVLTLLGAFVTIYGAYGVLVRTSDRSPWAWARRRRTAAPTTVADRQGNLGGEGKLAGAVIPLHGGAADIVAIYQRIDALGQQVAQQAANDRQQNADALKQSLVTNRANTRKQAIITLIGASITVVGIALRTASAFC